jgi:3-phenylpropionate/trans-cinnamate dioxygenase ferredoxin subunit
MTDYIRAASLDQVPPGKGRIAFVAGRTVALFNVGGQIYALNDSCPHAGSSLGMGQLDGAMVTCRGHGLRFDVRTGCMPGKGGLCVATYPVRVTDGEITVALESDS